jgi:hypothetical protein
MLMRALCFTAGAVLRLPSAQRRRHQSRCDDQDEQTDDDAADPPPRIIGRSICARPTPTNTTRPVTRSTR